jgi:hypothetical protein
VSARDRAGSSWPKQQILTDRNEGHYLVRTEADGTWIGTSKVVPAAFTSQGRNALLTDVPGAAIDVLRLTCPGLVTVVSN